MSDTKDSSLNPILGGDGGGDQGATAKPSGWSSSTEPASGLVPTGDHPSRGDIFGDFDAADYKPDLASAIAAEIMGLEWTHALPAGDDIQDEIDAEGEHCNRYGDVQEAVSVVLERSRTQTHTTRIAAAQGIEARSAETRSGSVEDESPTRRDAPDPSPDPTGGVPEEIGKAINDFAGEAYSTARGDPTADVRRARSTLTAAIVSRLTAAEAERDRLRTDLEAARVRGEKMEGALEFYADPQSFTFTGWQGDMDPPSVFVDRGNKARAALADPARDDVGGEHNHGA